MSIRNKLLSGGLITALVLGSAAAFAAESQTPKASELKDQVAAAKTPYPTQDGMLKTADDALQALTDVHAARLALAADDMDGAHTNLSSAMDAFNKSQDSWKALTVSDTEDPASAERFLPIDVAMSLGENFVPTPETGEALKAAKAQFQTGSDDKALDTLRVANVDVNVSAALVPVSATMDSLQQAQAALKSGDKVAADKALGAIEQSIVVRGFAIDGIPQQQGTAQDQTNASASGTSPQPADATSSS